MMCVPWYPVLGSNGEKRFEALLRKFRFETVVVLYNMGCFLGSVYKDSLSF